MTDETILDGHFDEAASVGMSLDLALGNEILKNSVGTMAPIVRRGGALIVEMDVSDESDRGVEPAKKTFKVQSTRNDDMEVDAISRGQFEAFWDWQDYESFCHGQT